MSSLGDFVNSRNIHLIAAAGVLGVTVLGLTTRLLGRSSSREILKRKEEEEEEGLVQKSTLSDQTTRPSSVMLSSRSNSPQQSPVMYSKSGIVPRNEGDSLFFQILESYGAARNSVLSPGLTASSGTSTPSLDPGAVGNGGGQVVPSSGRRKRRSKNAKKRTVATSN